jgi:arylsulfatase A-like enzyme
MYRGERILYLNKCMSSEFELNTRMQSTIDTLFKLFHDRTSTQWAIFLVAFMFSSSTYASDNILLIIADDFGVDAHGLYGVGSTTAPTPTIDALAAQGIRFDRAWSNPVCAPTRATILTGRYSFRTGVGFASGNNTINPAEYTVADALGALGYSTALFGKWHLGTGPSNRPNSLGFDHYAASLGGGMPDYFNWTKVENGVSTTVTNYATTENVDDAITWIDNQGSLNPNQPWFVWLAFNAPHSPFHKPPNTLHNYDQLSGTQTDISANPVPYYQAMVEAMDTEIGRLLDAVDANNTTIIFLGDNGTPRKVAVPPAEPTRVKGTLYQGGIWVPLIISGPAVTLPNRTSEALANTSDLFATIIEVAGGDTTNLVPIGIPIDSVSLMPILEQSTQVTSCKYVLAEHFRTTPANSDGKTIRNSQYKLIRFDLTGERLYALSNDPALYPTDEDNNLLEGELNSVVQANYDTLSSKLDSLLSGNDTDRICFTDADGDTVLDAQDNCPNDVNPNQEDNDGDAEGDVCDMDDDNDGLTDSDEDSIGTNNYLADTDNDGVSDYAEVYFDGLPDYNPATDMNPLSQNTDNDAYLDDVDPIPVIFNYEDGDVAPYGSPNGKVDVGDLFVGIQLILGLKQTTTLEKAHVDLYPVGAPDGVINLSDYIQLQRLMF